VIGLGLAASARAASGGAWAITTTKFVNRFDTEPYVGNGYFSQRIPAAGMGFRGGLGTVGWPLMVPRTTEALAAGLYAQMRASNFYPTENKQVIARIPTWSTLTFSAPGGATYSPETVTAAQISHYRQTSSLRTATVTTSGVWQTGGRSAAFTYRVFTDRANKHVGVVSLTLTPQWNGRTTVTALLDGRGASRLTGTGAGANLATHTSHVNSRAIGTGFTVSESQTLRFGQLSGLHDTAVGLNRPQTAGEQLSFVAHSGHTYTFTKYVGVATSRDTKQPSITAQASSAAAAALGRTKLARENGRAWSSIWSGGISVRGNRSLQTVIRANTRDLYASIRQGAPDAIGPSGLSSDGYAGMIFWDSDIWMFPAILAEHPDIARVDVDYRFHTLNAAKHDAAANGYKGAFYPWTAGDDGYTGHDCYGTITNANDKIISDPNKSCSQELHLQGDIAVAQWEYYQATGDKTWLVHHGWPVLKALAQFWVSKAKPSGNGAYSIDNVQPPDEAHTGVNNSTYTNAVAATALRDARSAAHVVGAGSPAIWSKVAAGLRKTMPFNSSKQIYEEFDGYNGDQIKQADVVMLTYPLRFPISKKVALNDLQYYAPRTNPKGPAMTDAIHSIDASTLNASGCSAYHYMVGSYKPFLRGPFDQFAETRRGNPETAFNFLTGVGGFLQVFQYGFSGLRFGTRSIHLAPSLPQQLRGITLNHLRWHGRAFTVAIGAKKTTVRLSSGRAMTIITRGGKRTLRRGHTLTLRTRRQTC
jgi:trehalose/maltose hydrolase-like predicted phosphorylase